MFKLRFSRRIIIIFNKYFPTLVAKLRYKKTFGHFPNLKVPQNLNEKILWLSLHSDISLWTKLADKYEVRDYVVNKGLGNTLVTLYGVWDDVESIDWDKLPESFVLKTTNGSGTNIIVPCKQQLDIDVAKKTLNKWLHTPIAQTTTEFHYNNIKPRIIAEEFLSNPSDVLLYSSTLIDYKIWCFNGKAQYVWACSNRIGDSTEVALFDRDWNYLPDMSVFTDHYKEQKHLVPKPKNLQIMLETAETLADTLPVVRVDLYNLNGAVYFGEMTFTSLGGQMDFYTQDALNSMGNMVDITNINKIRNKLF